MQIRKSLVTLRLEQDILEWLQKRAVVYESQIADLSAQVNLLLRKAMEQSNDPAFEEHRPFDDETDHPKNIPEKIIMQSCLESLMILRNSLLPDPEKQQQLSQEVRELIQNKLNEVDELADA